MKKLRFLLGFFGILLCFSSTISAFTGFSGRVTDICAGQPIAGAELRLRDFNNIVFTDQNGYYQLSVPVEGIFEIKGSRSQSKVIHLTHFYQ